MHDKYTSEKLLRELPRPLLNFLWYLWDTYSNPEALEFRILIKAASDADGQLFIINSIGKTVTQDLGYNIETDIVIRNNGTRFFMEHY